MPAIVIQTDLGEARVEADVVYGTGGGRDLHCDIYHPAERTAPAPAILMIHGGGWRQGARNMPGIVSFGALLSAKGYVCVSIEYRLSGETAWPAQLDDAKAALRWVRANAGRLGIDPQRITVLGKSAGAHITLMLAATANDPAHEGTGGSPGVATDFAAAVAFYPPTRMNRPDIAASDAVRALMGENHNPEALAAVSPLEYAGSRPFPPTLLLHGTKDVVVSPGDSTHLYDALVRARQPVELHMLAGLPHGFDNGNPRLQRLCAETIDLFLERFVLVPA